MRLLFAYRLEKVAKKLSLSLTQIIVQSCCTNIPSKIPLKQGTQSKSVTYSSFSSWVKLLWRVTLA